jgi:hypothetical protein
MHFESCILNHDLLLPLSLEGGSFLRHNKIALGKDSRIAQMLPDTGIGDNDVNDSPEF